MIVTGSKPIETTKQALLTLFLISCPFLFAHSVVLGQQPTPSQTPSPTFNPTPIPTLSPSIEERIKTLEQKLKQNESNPKPKDVWDKLNAVSGLISGGVVAIIGILATYIYNERQRKNAEKQNQNEINILQVQCDRRSCRVRSPMWLLLLQRSIFGERTMHINCSCGFKCNAAPKNERIS